MSLPRPPELLRWSTDETNDAAPLEAKKDTGYVVDEEPSSAEINYNLRIAGEQQEWLRERVDDGRLAGGSDPGDLQIQAQTLNAGDVDAGGELGLSGGDAGAANKDGGDVILTGGTGNGSGDGGDLTITGGIPGATGSAGAWNLLGNTPTDAVGVDCTAQAGAGVGTDRRGGFLRLLGGASTGDQGSTIVMSVANAGTPGSVVRNPAEAFSCDGTGAVPANNSNHVLQCNNLNGTRGALRISSRIGAAMPSGPATGDVIADQNDNLYFWNGAYWAPLDSRRKVQLTIATQLVAAGQFDNADYTIPANSLRVGDVIKFDHAGVYDPSATGAMTFSHILNAATALSVTLTVATTGAGSWMSNNVYVVTAIGGGGNLRGYQISSNADANTGPKANSAIAINTTVANTFHLGLSLMSFGTADCYIANVGAE